MAFEKVIDTTCGHGSGTTVFFFDFWRLESLVLFDLALFLFFNMI